MNKLIFEPLGLMGLLGIVNRRTWPYILVIVNAWKSIGYFSIVYLAAIVGIDSEYYEAAVLDGANKWQQVRSITLPLIIPIIMVLVLLQIGKIFYADFGLFFQVPMNTGALMSTTDVFGYLCLPRLLQMGDIGMASAAGLYQSGIRFPSRFGVNYLSKNLTAIMLYSKAVHLEQRGT